jgi:hypothetical protein
LIESAKKDLLETTHITKLLGPMPEIEGTIWVHFTEFNEGKSCRVSALSRSPKGFMFDYGTNYCNMYNLAVGAGLTHESVEFSEYTNRMLCTAYDTPLLKEKHCPERNCCLAEYTGRRHGQPGPDLNVPSAAPKIEH